MRAPEDDPAMDQQQEKPEEPVGETMVGDAGVTYVAPAEADLDAEDESPVL